MKAPNGTPSNLTAQQWVQVRTPEFKKWFGDWEAAYLTGMAKEVWNGSHVKARFIFLPSDKLKTEIKNLTGNSLEKIVITDSDIRHIKNRHGQNQTKLGQIDITPEDIALIPFVMNEFDTIKVDYTIVSKDREKLSRIAFTKQINGTALVASIERKSGKSEQIVTFYKMESKAASVGNTTPALTSVTRNAQFTIQQAHDLCNACKNTSKAVDENGEPLVTVNARGESVFVNSITGQEMPVMAANSTSLQTSG